MAAVRRALGERTDMDIAKKNVAANDVTLRYLNDQTLPQVDLAGDLRPDRAVGGSQLITEGTGVNRHRDRQHAGRLRRRAGLAVPIELSDLDRADELLAIRSASARSRRRLRARACS